MTRYSFKNSIPQIHSTAFIESTAKIIGNVQVGKNSSVWFYSVLRGDFDKIVVGDNTNIQDLCVCHADKNVPLKIGNGVTVGHRCVIHGCTIKDDCLIGMGSIIMNNAVIGKGSTVAAGSVVLENTIVPPYSLITGIPGKIKITYKNKAKIQQKMKNMSEEYIRNTEHYKSDQIFYKVQKG